MEKHELKLKSKILKIIPKVVTLTFQNPPFSPGRRDHKPHGGGKGFSGPMIPFEARRNQNNDGIDYQEPTSPKISCMGQIKHKKKHPKKAKASNVNTSSSSTSRDIVVKKHVTKFQRMFSNVGKQKTTEGRRKSDASASHDNKYTLEEKVPHVSQMKRFSSGRDTFANFDWKAQVVPTQAINYYSDEERVQSDTDDDEDEEIMIPFSAPLYGGVLDLKPRKEINLWKRRTMAPPIPLQLDPVN